MIEKYGADALRLSVIIGNAPGQDFRMYEEKIAGYRNFINKLWNIGRFVQQQPHTTGPAKAVAAADEWILNRLSEVTDQVTTYFEKYQFSAAGQALYDFVWHDVADWYVEWTKFSPNPGVLRHVFLGALRLLHPLVPFVTERLWSDLGEKDLLMVTPWPRRTKSSARGREFVRIQTIVSRLRTFKTHTDLGSAVGEVVASPEEAAAWQALSRVRLRGVERLGVGGDCATIDLAGVAFSFPSEIVERFEGWRQKEQQRIRGYIHQLRGKLDSKNFVEHAPAEVVTLEREKLAAAENDLRALE